MAERTSRSLRKLIQDVTGTLGTRVITMGFGLFTGIITARALGPENRGIFTLAALFPASLVTLSKLGQGIASVYFIRREKEDISQVASNLLFLALAIGIVLSALGYFLKDFWLEYALKGVPLWALIAVLPLAPILLTESYLYGLLQATDRFRVYNTRLLAEAVLTLGGMALALLVFKAGLSGAFLVAVGVRTLMVSWVILTIHRGTPFRFRFDTDLFKRMLRYGLKSHVQIIASHFHFKAAMYLVAYYTSPAQVAFYGIASRLAEHILWVPQSLGMVLFPRLAGSEEEKAHEMTAMAVRQSVCLTAIVAVGVSLFGGWLVTTWYGADYAPAARPLTLCSAAIVMMSAFVLLSRNFTSRNKQTINILAAYVALLGNIILNVILIPKYGIEGAAFATIGSYGTAASILLFFFVRDSGISVRRVLLPERSDIELWRNLLSDMWSNVRSTKA